MILHRKHLLTISIILLSTKVFTQSVDDSIHDTIYDGCDDYKECFGFGFSEDCVSSRDCLSFGAVYKDGDDFIFEMKGQAGNGYIASGLSTDGRMGDDSVVECVKQGNDVKMYMSYTGEFDVSRDDVPQNSAKLLNSYIIDNTIYCRVSRHAVSAVKGLTFDLNNSEYYVMFVSGPVKDDNTLDYHNVKFYSPTAVKFTNLRDISHNHIREKRSPSSEDIYKECQKTKTYRCFGDENDCEKDANCSAMAIVSQHDEIHTFKLVSFAEYKYVALALTEENKIRNGDPVFECVNNDGKVNAYFSTYDSSQRYRVQRRSAKAMKLTDGRLIENHHLYCNIEYDNASNSSHVKFSYKRRFFMISTGTDLDENSLKYVEFSRVSLSQMSLSEHKSFTKPSRVLLQLHGSIMIIAWLGCCALSTLFPMHYKKCFRTRSIFGKDVWFGMHMILNISTVVLWIIAFAIILYDRGGFVAPNPHWIFAIVAMLFSIGQFIYGYLRPRPLTTAREYFKLFHWFGANMTLMFATAAVFFAIPNPKSELPRSSAWYFLLFVFNFVATHGSLYLVAYYQKRVNYKPSPLAELDKVPKHTMTPEMQKYYRFQTIRTIILWTFITIQVGLICGALWLIWREKE
ncbi:putative ferric-chelate reductase 1 homolog isoform X2 [Chironomus tepperi]|uniref:putative ferric-chelate reductase 1 homolog isoform X2 n=1 Tax=Chironomus tepperi TaxID=113505 RepID=UPI00391FB5FA